MRLTIVGSGDAFGSGGRFNTCFFLETAKGTLLVDCGASALVALKAQGLDPNGVDGIVLSHLHGDHFGGLPFLLLDGQFLCPPRAAADDRGAARHARPPRRGCSKCSFRDRPPTNGAFHWKVLEIEVGRPTEVLGHSVTTTEVVHYSGAPSTALRLSDGESAVRLFRRHRMGRGAAGRRRRGRSVHCRVLQLFRSLTGHLTWEVLKPRLPDLRARRIMLTHMNPTMLARLDEVRAAGVLVAEDGAVLEF